MALKIKKGDEVVIIAGKDKGRRGKVTRVINKQSSRGEDKRYFYVEGLNLIKKHVKPNPQLEQAGGIVQKEAPIDASNLAIFNSVTQKPDRVGFKILSDGRKVRIFKSSGEQIDI